MNPFKLKRLLPILLLTLTLGPLAGTAGAEVILQDLNWTVVGSSVEFHAFFHNTDPTLASGLVTYELNSQQYGAFVPIVGPICNGTISDIAPLGTQEVICTVPLADLPPSAEVILPTAGSPGRGISGLAAVCDTSAIYWAGNVDVFWTPGTGASVGVHFGNMLVCPGGPASYIHIVMDCNNSGGITWSFSALCPGFTATLVNDSSGLPGTPVVGAIPTGLFDGWICVSADSTVADGTVCYPQLDVSCGGVPASIVVCVEACNWTGPTPIDKTTWGEIKIQNLDQDN